MFQVANQNSLCGNMFSTKIHFFGVQIHKKSNFHWIFHVLVISGHNCIFDKIFQMLPLPFLIFLFDIM